MEKIYDFNVSYTCRHEESNKNFKEMAVIQVLKLSQFHKHIIDCDIIIDKQNSSFISEIILRVPGHTFRAEHKDYHQIKAFDNSLEKIKIQLKKLKSKVVDHRIAFQPDKFENTESEISDDFE